MIFNWIYGRQNSGYLKMKLLEVKIFKIDCYLLKFPEGSYIRSHIDPVTSDYDHHRLNIVLKSPKVGGIFRHGGNTSEGVFLGFKWFRFRPDITYHSVTEVTEGTRYVLSIGWVKKSNINKLIN